MCVCVGGEGDIQFLFKPKGLNESKGGMLRSSSVTSERGRDAAERLTGT